MPQNQADAYYTAPERRASARSRVSCPAILQTPGGVRRGQMSDLSVSGARLQVDNPPPKGAVGLLEWEGFDSMCRVVWVTDDTCGVEFDRPIARAIVDQCAGRETRKDETVAAFAKIPIGTRRTQKPEPPRIFSIAELLEEERAAEAAATAVVTPHPQTPPETPPAAAPVEADAQIEPNAEQTVSTESKPVVEMEPEQFEPVEPEPTVPELVKASPELAHPAANTGFGYWWSVNLSRPDWGGAQLRADHLTAEEQMFFGGSPLSHIALFDERGRPSTN